MPERAAQSAPARELGSTTETGAIRVEVTPGFLPEQSDPASGQFVFGYAVRIANTGENPVKLVSRRWEIVDADGSARTVEGEGVVGRQPTIEPGGVFEYSSFCPLRTPWGTMEGAFAMLRFMPSGESRPFSAGVARFFLVAEAYMPGAGEGVTAREGSGLGEAGGGGGAGRPRRG